MSPSRRLGLGLLALTALLGLALFRLQRDKPSTLPSPTGKGIGVKVAQFAHPDPEREGTVEGDVFLNGPTPQRAPLKLGADPVCAKVPTLDEQVLIRDGKIRNVLVRIANGPTRAAPSWPIEVNQEGCAYRPRIQGAVAGQALVIHTSDPTLHNVHAYAGGSTAFNQAQPPGSGPIERSAGETARLLKLKCDIHPWMTAYVVVSNNSFFGLTGENGDFQIQGVPAGNYVLEAWHERFGKKVTAVRVIPGQTARVRIDYSPEDRD